MQGMVSVKGAFIAIVSLLAVSAGAAVQGGQADQAQSQPASPPPQWGNSKAGLQTSLSLKGRASVGGKLVFDLRLRNVGTAAVSLGPAEGVFGWLVIEQAPTRFYSERIYCAAGSRAWPGQLPAGGGVLLEGIDLSGRRAFPYALRREVLEGFLAGKPDAELPKPAGELTELLSAGKARAAWMLCLGRQGAQPLVLASNTVEIDLDPPDLKAMSAEARERFVSRLLSEFKRGAGPAMQAHHTAVKVGKALVPHLITLAADRQAPYFARMWSAAALADIGDPQAADTLAELLADGDSGVRYVAAYHGPKLRCEKLDQAIAAKGQTGQEPMFTAWAVQGYLEFRQSVPDGLLAAALASKEPRARAAAAGALSKRPDERSFASLLDLLSDTDEQVRSAAAKALGNVRATARKGQALKALIVALDRPGEHARQGVCAALCKLTGKQIPYDPQADPQERDAAIQAWKDWWAKGPHGP